MVLASTDSADVPRSGVLTKRAIWTLVVAVAVMVLLSGVLAYLQYWAPMRVTVYPENTTVDAGGAINLSVTMKKGLRSLHDSDGTTYLWEAEPAALGSFFLRGEQRVNFTAGNDACNGTISCRVEYKGETARDALKLTVKPAYLKELSVTPSPVSFFVGKQRDMTATAFDSVGREMPNASIEWSTGGTVDLDLNTTTGRYTCVTCAAGDGDATIMITATAGGHNASASVPVQVKPWPARTVAYRWYDMFNVPFGEWYDSRWNTIHTEQPLSDTYPYIYRTYDSPPWNTRYYTNMRLDVTGRNMSELNMSSHPEFLPFLGSARGGIVTIDWYMQYLTKAEYLRKFSAIPMSWEWSVMTGWVISLNGTTTMDKQASMAVLNVTSAGYDGFATWWADNEARTEKAYSDWLLYEGNKRLDIYTLYEYALTPLGFDLTAQKVGDKIVLSYDIISWGMEALMTRWLHEAFMPTEWYFEDFRFNATIGPDMADLDISTAVEYAAHAWESNQTPGEPCWVWEGMLQDRVQSGVSHNKSLFDPYADKKYVVQSPGSQWYGLSMNYEYTPGAFNLSKDEVMTIEWPSGPQQFIVDIAPLTTTNVSSNMTVKYSEPMDSDLPGRVVTDTDARTITFTGPIDMWTWSRDQTDHAWLVSEWSRLGLLPQGMPYIEFAMVA